MTCKYILENFTKLELVLLTLSTISVITVIFLSFSYHLVIPSTGNNSYTYLSAQLHLSMKKKTKRSIENCDCPITCEESNNNPIPVEEKIFSPKPKIYAKKIFQYPYLVSLSVPLWNDDISSESQLYQCAGVIINKDTILTSYCIDVEEWSVVTIRAGSDIWSYGGTIHSVISMTKFINYVTIKIIPEFSFDNVIKNFKVRHNKDWKVATLIGWQMNGKILSKYKPFEIQVVDKSIASCVNCTSNSEFECAETKLGLTLSYNDSFIIINADRDCYKEI